MSQQRPADPVPRSDAEPLQQRPPVLGPVVDDETRCIHWSSPLDIVAIRFACCGDFYPCDACHAETAGHVATQWPADARDERAVLCGVCGHLLTIDEYGVAVACPACAAPCNPGCALHWHRYFDGPPPAVPVVLRVPDAADAAVLAAWHTDAIFAAHAEWRSTDSVADGVEWWLRQIAHPDPLLDRRMVERAGALIGYVDLHGDEPGVRELGYVIGPSSAWRRGWATQAAREALEVGFGELGLDRIWAEAVTANTASVRVLERIGMRRTGFGDVHAFLGETSRYERFEIRRTEV